MIKVITQLHNMSIPLNINDPFDQIKNYFDTVLNIEKNLVKTSNDEPTPITCVEEMVSKLPPDIFKNPNYKFLDPCCGCGNFFLVIYNKLKAFHETKHILENMYISMIQTKID